MCTHKIPQNAAYSVYSKNMGFASRMLQRDYHKHLLSLDSDGGEGHKTHVRGLGDVEAGKWRLFGKGYQSQKNKRSTHSLPIG